MAKLPGNEEVKLQMQSLGFYLPNIRNGFNWNLDDVGERLGVSKQTVLNIEKQARKTVEDNADCEKMIIEKDCMSYAQYVTLRIIIEDEINSLKDKDEETAKKINFILKVLVDGNMEELKDEHKKKMKDQDMLTLMSAVASAATLPKLFGALRGFGFISPWAAVTVGATTVLNWLKPWKVFEKEKTDKKK